MASGESSGSGSVTDDGLGATLPTTLRQPRGRHAVRRGLLLGWIVLLALGAGFGERTSSWDRLQAAVASGDVDRVEVVGGLPDGATGYSQVELHWHSGAFRDVTVVVETSPGEMTTASGEVGGTLPVVRGDVVDLLTATQPGLDIDRGSERGSSTSYFGWQVPPWFGVVGMALGLATLLVLVVGPEPWRATRWAWFWAMLLAYPVGMIAFLALAGPTPGVASPRARARRLTGGWAFIAMLVVHQIFVA